MAGKRTSLKNTLMVGILGAGFITVLALTLASLFLISEANRNSLNDLEHELRSSFDRLIRFQTETAYTMLEEMNRLSEKGLLSGELAMRRPHPSSGKSAMPLTRKIRQTVISGLIPARE